MSTQQPAVAAHDALVLVERLRELSSQMPPLTVAAELACVGPLLFAVVGGRDGVREFRDGVLLDDAVFIDSYREAFEVLLAGTPGGSALLRLVDLAVVQDRRENAALLAAFDLLDPDSGAAPRLLAATRYSAPAAAHALAKFLLLAPPAVPAAVRYYVLRARVRGAGEGTGDG